MLRSIAHKKANRLPKKQLCVIMLIECLTCAQAQLGENLFQQDGTHYTLQSDGTTKHGQHFTTLMWQLLTLHLLLIGHRHILSGSAQNTLDTLLEILDDLDAE